MTSPKGNNQNQVPRRFRERIQNAKDNKLKELDLSNDFYSRDDEKLTEIPTEVWELAIGRVCFPRLSGHETLRDMFAEQSVRIKRSRNAPAHFM